MTHPTHKLMQRVPTDEMIQACIDAEFIIDAKHLSYREIYQAMYDAAPEPIEESWGDVTDEFTEAINAAHPCETENYEDYAKAHSMVSNRHSKSALVDLVNWLLVRENLSNNPENLYTSGECVKKVCIYNNPDCPICPSPEPTKETAECGSKCQLDCENYVAAMYEIKEIVRVAKTNAQGLSLFLQQNFPKEWKDAPEPVCTPSCGNVFLDLGFPPDEARDLTIKAQEKHVVRLTTERDALKAELKEAVEALKEISLGSLVQREVDIVRAVLSKHPDGQGEW
jgi:hypothetical protein